MTSFRFSNSANFFEKTYSSAWVWLYSRHFRLFGKRNRLVYPDIIKGEQHISLGDDVYIGRKGWLQVLGEKPERGLLIHSQVYIGRYCHIVSLDSIEIRSKVLIADRVYIADHSRGYEDIHVAPIDASLKPLSRVVIDEGAWLGENVCIIGASVGKHSVIGANSVVTSDIPDYCVAVGAPAKIVKRFSFETQRWDVASE
jgi:acetyltransferase-like isoleucine patch superfamily enzyme